MARYLYSELSRLVASKQYDACAELCKDHMPSGSGFDNGTWLWSDKCHADKLVFNTAFHHMDENGTYDGWTDHTITVTPSLAHTFHLRVSGRNRNDIKDYIAEAFHKALQHDLEPRMQFDAVAERTGCKVVGRWLDGCTQVWDVVIPKREHVWTPAVGERVKLRTLADYQTRDIHMWAWLAVDAIQSNGDITVEVLNGQEHTGVYHDVPLVSIAVPLNWTPTWDADEAQSEGFVSWWDAQAWAVEHLTEVR